MASKGPAENRLKSYKTKGLDVSEVRRRREEEGVQLRRSRREEQYSKRRNLTDVDELEAENATFPEGTPFTEVARALFANETEQQLAALARFRKALSKFGQSPPIQEVIDTGCVPRVVEILTFDNPSLQFEAAWVLTNIASGSSLQTRTVIGCGAVPHLVKLLTSQHEFVLEQAVWALGNIAGDSPECRDVILGSAIMPHLLKLLLVPDLNLTVLRNAAWTLSNLCRGKNPEPPSDVTLTCVPVLARLLYHTDPDVLCHSCWTAAFIADGPDSRIQRIVDGGLVNRLVELMLHHERSVVTPALRAVGNILTGDDVQTQVVINCSVLPSLITILATPHENLRKEACWAISNITAGNRVQIQAVIDCNVFPLLIDIMNSGSVFKTRKEAAWAILNATSGGTRQQIRYLASIGCIKPLCDMLTVQDSRIVTITLEGLENFLKVGQIDAGGAVNPYSLLIEEAYGLSKIEDLQSHENEQIYCLAGKLIDMYFEVEETVSSSDALPQGQVAGPEHVSSSMNFVVNSNGTPEGGFKF
ncbi:Importin subunit alpha-7 [Geodia barretti]|uniref:Importin subunit alpha n=1 Tax=Geodia barretti TaxID=519541 RepID=A0AA35T7C9_GEOBA|nr:Importin subunit alpha-7 [Geodia barretti]